MVNRRDDIADVALTIAVEHLEAEELRAWSDADEAHNLMLIKRQDTLTAAWAAFVKASPPDEKTAFTKAWMDARKAALTKAGLDPIFE